RNRTFLLFALASNTVLERTRDDALDVELELLVWSPRHLFCPPLSGLSTPLSKAAFKLSAKASSRPPRTSVVNTFRPLDFSEGISNVERRKLAKITIAGVQRANTMLKQDSRQMCVWYQISANHKAIGHTPVRFGEAVSL